MTLSIAEKVALAREAYGEGLGNVREWRTPEAFDWQHEEPDGEFIESGDRLLVGIRSRARGRGSEIEVEQSVFHVVTFRDGKVAKLEIHFDRASATRSLEAG